jgi:hypothetical protein
VIGTQKYQVRNHTTASTRHASKEELSRTHLLRAPSLFSLVSRRKHARLRGMQHRAAGEPPPPQNPPDGTRRAQGGAPRCRSMGSARAPPPCRGPNGRGGARTGERRRRREGRASSQALTEALFGRAPRAALPNGENGSGSGCGAGAGAPRGSRRRGGARKRRLRAAPPHPPTLFPAFALGWGGGAGGAGRGGAEAVGGGSPQMRGR